MALAATGAQIQDRGLAVGSGNDALFQQANANGTTPMVQLRVPNIFRYVADIVVVPTTQEMELAIYNGVRQKLWHNYAGPWLKKYNDAIHLQYMLHRPKRAAKSPSE